jgi:hypothetical protein
LGVQDHHKSLVEGVGDENIIIVVVMAVVVEGVSFGFVVLLPLLVVGSSGYIVREFENFVALKAAMPSVVGFDLQGFDKECINKVGDC